MYLTTSVGQKFRVSLAPCMTTIAMIVIWIFNIQMRFNHLQTDLRLLTGFSFSLVMA